MSCLRPAPPTRSYLSQPGEAIGSSGGNRGSGHKKKGRKYSSEYKYCQDIIEIGKKYCSYELYILFLSRCLITKLAAF